MFPVESCIFCTQLINALISFTKSRKVMDIDYTVISVTVKFYKLRQRIASMCTMSARRTKIVSGDWKTTVFKFLVYFTVAFIKSKVCDYIIDQTVKLIRPRKARLQNAS